MHVRLLEAQRKRTYYSVFSSSMPLSVADSTTSVDDGTDAHFNAHSCPMPDSHTIKKQRPTNIISPELASALDRTNVSDRNATYLLAATGQNLEDFVTENTLKFFEILELPSKILTETEIEQWEENEHFQKAKQCAQSIRVVNDVAERDVKLIQDFNSSITRNEEQKQYRLYLSTELSFLRQRRVCYFRDFNNLNISIKSLTRNLLSKGFIICISFQLVKTIIWFTLLQYPTDLFVAKSILINLRSVSLCHYKKLC